MHDIYRTESQINLYESCLYFLKIWQYYLVVNVTKTLYLLDKTERFIYLVQDNTQSENFYFF